MPATWRIEVLLLTTIGEARRWVPPHAATLTETADGVLLHDYADSLDWMARMLVSLGCRFVVREPPELRAALRVLAAEVAEVAGAVAPATPPPPGFS